MPALVTRFTGDFEVRFLRADDPLAQGRKRKRSYAMGLQALAWEIDYTGAPLPPTPDPAQYVIIPRGFVYDGVTVPRVLWWFVPPWGSMASRAAALHDYLLEALTLGAPHPRFVTRTSIDNVFYEALLACGVRPFKAWLMWQAVRAFGRAKTLWS